MAAQTISMNRIRCLRLTMTRLTSADRLPDIDRPWPSTIQWFTSAEAMCSGAKEGREAAPACSGAPL